MAVIRNWIGNPAFLLSGAQGSRDVEYLIGFLKPYLFFRLN